MYANYSSFSDSDDEPEVDLDRLEIDPTDDGLEDLLDGLSDVGDGEVDDDEDDEDEDY